MRAGHYGFMAALAFTVIGIGLLTSLRPAGWRLTAWVAGLIPVLLGVASLIYPDAPSSLAPLWALAAIAWGAAYVGTAEVVRLRHDRTAVISPSEPDEGVAAATAGVSERGVSRRPSWLRSRASLAS